jgi:hypothetical protein
MIADSDRSAAVLLKEKLDEARAEADSKNAQRIAAEHRAMAAERERDEARAEVERLREAAASSMALCSWECSDETYCGRCKPLVRALNEADE